MGAIWHTDRAPQPGEVLGIAGIPSYSETKPRLAGGQVRFGGCPNVAAWRRSRVFRVGDMHGHERSESFRPVYNFGNRDIETKLFLWCEYQGVSATPQVIE